jgi:hypothetical protein
MSTRMYSGPLPIINNELNHFKVHFSLQKLYTVRFFKKGRIRTRDLYWPGKTMPSSLSIRTRIRIRNTGIKRLGCPDLPSNFKVSLEFCLLGRNIWLGLVWLLNAHYLIAVALDHLSRFLKAFNIS